MKALLSLLVVLVLQQDLLAQRTIHVFVALCDNQNQKIAPVPKDLGNGKDPKSNLYWGAAYGVKSYLEDSSNWTLVKAIAPGNPLILERLLFKHTTEDVFLLADAYDGEKIKNCTEDFLMATNSQNRFQIICNSMSLKFGGSSDLVAYVGHDGLMDFYVDMKYDSTVKKGKDAIVLACYSKNFFAAEMTKSKANPILWTTHLMAPEAYTLDAAIDGWIANESGTQIEERAAQAYDQYQRCGIKGARNLFATGF